MAGATTRYYFGAYEKDIERIGNVTQTDYIYTPAGLTAMMKGGTLYYIHTDNLGSIQAITDESKNTVSSYYYTPWGARVLLSGVNITDRGYTFHEHLEPFCLINMNGRVYDPMLARFLSPDPYVQMPDYTQNFNRYSYCLNNPFKYTDPSGESVILAAIIGAAIAGGIGYTASVAFSDYGLCAWSSNDFFKAMAVGAISGAVTCGIGSAFGTTGSIIKGTFDVGKELARAGAHALANGFISVATGDEFLPGFVAGGMGSFGGSLFQGMAGGIMQAHPILEAIGTVGSSAVSGGIGAELTGGDFWRGAATGPSPNIGC